jgi:hypothetical protein
MKIKPMLGEYEFPGIQRIGAIEGRCLVEIAVPGLEGSYQQDLGSASAAIRIEGTLSGDEARDDFLNAVREMFKTGEAVDFVADITTATEVDQVLVSDLEVVEVAGSTDGFRYAVTLTQYVEPPPMTPASDLGFGDLAALDAALDLEAGDLFDVLQIPDMLGSIPELSDPTPPLQETLEGVKSAMEALGGISENLKGLFGEG